MVAVHKKPGIVGQRFAIENHSFMEVMEKCNLLTHLLAQMVILAK
jgi:hypothetical protein